MCFNFDIKLICIDGKEGIMQSFLAPLGMDGHVLLSEFYMPFQEGG